MHFTLLNVANVLLWLGTGISITIKCKNNDYSTLLTTL